MLFRRPKFLKGGYVGVPVGFAAASKKIPFVTHDSDALPGIANQLTARWAVIHATGMPEEYYTYPKDSVRYIGVLVGEQYSYVNEIERIKFRRELDLPDEEPILLVTGGSLGAQRLNHAFSHEVPELLLRHPRLIIIHQVGKGKAGLYSHLQDRSRVHELEFLSPMERYTGAADVVVTRAGANTLAELGVQGKACVVVPNRLLTAGHQLKNAEYLLSKGAVLSVDEDTFANDTSVLRKAIEQLLDEPGKREQLIKKLHALVKPHAAKELAEILINIAKR